MVQMEGTSTADELMPIINKKKTSVYAYASHQTRIFSGIRMTVPASISAGCSTQWQVETSQQAVHFSNIFFCL
jgi:hypothetical protein